MKSLQQIYEHYRCSTLDGRDIIRLAMFVPEEDLPKLGLELRHEYKGKHKPIPFTRENVLEQLRCDVASGFNAALNNRGISASLMFEAVRMWNWILEEGLEDWPEDRYAQYGLPLFKATAVKYGFDNPIGDDEGTEYKYSSDYDWDLFFEEED